MLRELFIDVASPAFPIALPFVSTATVGMAIWATWAAEKVPRRVAGMGRVASFLAWLGYGIVAFNGIDAALFWLPLYWRDGIAVLGAMAGSFLLLDFVNKHALMTLEKPPAADRLFSLDGSDD